MFKLFFLDCWKDLTRILLISFITLSVYGSTLVAAPLAFERHEPGSPYRNYFFQDGDVAAHVVLTESEKPRIVFAFPAGNSGAGLVFTDTPAATSFKVLGNNIQERVTAVRENSFRGVRLHLKTSQNLRLNLNNAFLGSVRLIREYVEGGGKRVEGMGSTIRWEGPTLVIERTMLDGRHHLFVRITPTEGSIHVDASSGQTVIELPQDFTIEAATDETPLTPIAMEDMFLGDAPGSLATREALAFLSYEEKLLAGSWRFLTYFGRDTLLSTRLLMPVVSSKVIEAALKSVIERLWRPGTVPQPGQKPPIGTVAHEEDIGDWKDHQQLINGCEQYLSADKPVFDYRMVDSDFLLAPVLASYLLDHPQGIQRTEVLLNHDAANLNDIKARLIENFKLVVSLATPFGENPSDFHNLISLRDGEIVGDWRDSSEGLGMGRYSFNLNGSLVPAALDSIHRLLTEVDALAGHEDLAHEALRLANIWERHAVQPFMVTRSTRNVRELINDDSITFHAVALDEAGNPIPVMNTDGGFRLLFNQPTEAELQQIATYISTDFPAGLWTPVGLPVANPAYANESYGKLFTNGKYHGRKAIWSWQMAMLAAGLDRQLARTDLSLETRGQLLYAQQRLWQALKRVRDIWDRELWGWELTPEGEYQPVSFGLITSDGTEANAIQLWSTVFLAVFPP